MSASGVPRRHQTDWPVLFSPHSTPASGSLEIRRGRFGSAHATSGSAFSAASAAGRSLGADHLDVRERQFALGDHAGVGALGTGEPAVTHDDDLVADVRPRRARQQSGRQHGKEDGGQAGGH